MGKKWDIVAVVGEYQKGGETKKRYQNVGVIMEGEHGPYMLLSKTFNPAGLAESGRESIMLNLFEPKDKPQSSQQQDPQSSDPFGDDMDVPF